MYKQRFFITMLLNNYPDARAYLPFNTLNHTQLWLATDTITQNLVFIKQLNSGFKVIQYQQFHQEYRVYQALSNLPFTKQPYFAKLLDAQFSDKNNWLVLEFCQGNTLKQLIRENALNFTLRIAYLIELCTAIETLHEQGFIHCDIKSSNILISHQQLKLFDFGLAKDIGQNEHVHNTAGTPAYMSPEQFIGEPVTYQTDYYSLGVVIYEVFSGKKPFYADSLADWAIAHCQLPIPMIIGFTPLVSHQVQGILNQLLAKFAKHRPPDLLNIKLALKKLLKA